MSGAPARAWGAYRRALLCQICDRVGVGYARLTGDLSFETTAALRVRTARPVSIPIASAGARQGLPTAILTPGAAS